MEEIPTNTKKNAVSNKLGIKDAAKTAKPNSREALTTLYGLMPLRLAKKIPPKAAPNPIEAVK